MTGHKLLVFILCLLSIFLCIGACVFAEVGLGCIFTTLDWHQAATLLAGNSLEDLREIEVAFILVFVAFITIMCLGLLVVTTRWTAILLNKIRYATGRAMELSRPILIALFLFVLSYALLSYLYIGGSIERAVNIIMTFLIGSALWSLWERFTHRNRGGSTYR